MPQLAQRLRFNLTNSFPRNVEHLADFLKGVFAAIVQTSMESKVMPSSASATFATNRLPIPIF